MTQIIKNLLATPETRVQSLGEDDPLERRMDTHSSMLAWRIPCTEKPDGLQSMGSESDTTEDSHTQVEFCCNVEQFLSKT